MLAGHETTAKAVGILSSVHSLDVGLTTLQLTFTLWEMAKHRKCQEKLRAEINETLEKIKARGDADFTANDLENMPYLVAVTKVPWNHLVVSLDSSNSCVGIFENQPHPYRRDTHTFGR